MKFITDDDGQGRADRSRRRRSRPPGAGSVNYVADWVMDVLDDLIGRVEQDIVVETSIDPALQAAAEKALTEELAQQGEKAGVGQGALVAMTPDGAVRALVGGRNYAESQFNRAVAAKRQPGSAFKPFVYLTALERGLTPDTVREDEPVAVKGWPPENYSREYLGPVTLTQALAHVAQHRLGAADARSSGRPRWCAPRTGSASPRKLEPNASIALGTSEVSRARAGRRLCAVRQRRLRGRAACGRARAHAPTASCSTSARRDSLGRIVEPRYVAMMNAMMQETLLTGTARKADLPGWPAAGKTGTSQDFRDAWFIGYTSHLVTGVWLGNDDNSPTKQDHRRRPAGRDLEPVHAARRIRACRSPRCPDVERAGLRRRAARRHADRHAARAHAPRRGGHAPSPPAGGGIDSWLIDRLFGRR